MTHQRDDELCRTLSGGETYQQSRSAVVSEWGVRLGVQSDADICHISAFASHGNLDVFFLHPTDSDADRIIHYRIRMRIGFFKSDSDLDTRKYINNVSNIPNNSMEVSIGLQDWELLNDSDLLTLNLKPFKPIDHDSEDDAFKFDYSLNPIKLKPQQP